MIPELIVQCSELGYESDVVGWPIADVVYTPRDPEIVGLFREEGMVLENPNEIAFTPDEIERRLSALPWLRGTRKQESYT